MCARNYPEAVFGRGQSSVRHHKDVIAARNVDVEQETNEVTVVVLA